MDRLENMITFVRVAEAESFTAAADQMSIAKSAVSRRVTELETYLGVRLLTRTTRRLNLTETGRTYLASCRRLLASLEELEEETRDAHASLHGTLRIACPLSFGNHHLIPAFVDFMAQHPDLDLDLIMEDRRTDLVAEGVDLSIRIGYASSASLKARRFTTVRFCTCASPDYLDRFGRPSRPLDLEKGHRGLLYANVPEHLFWRFRDETGQSISPRVPAHLRANNSDIIVAAAVAGLGITTMPTFVAYRVIAEGKLVTVLDEYVTAEETGYIVYPVGQPLSRKARTLIDFLVARFGDEPYWDQRD